MKFKEFSYKVEAVVTFTKAEAEVLVTLANHHYDSTCVASGLSSGESHPKVGTAATNGFLAQLKLFPGSTVWSFRNFDLALKVLEGRGICDRAGILTKTQAFAAGRLNTELNAMCDALNAEYTRLVSETREA